MTIAQADALFLSLNDFLSRVLPFRPFMHGEQAPGLRGGLPRIAKVISDARQEHPGPVVALVAGIDLAGPWYDLLGGAVEMQTLEKAGFDLGVPGVHEFESTPEHVRSAYRASRLPILTANLESGLPDFASRIRDHLILTANGLKIGIFGLAMSGPGMRLDSGDMFKEKCDVIQAAREQVQALQEAECAIIAAATHIGTQADCRVAENVPGIHAIFGAHSHTPTSKPLIVTAENGWQTLVTQAGTAGASLGQMHLFIRNGRVDLERTTWNLIPVDEAIPADTHLQDELLRAEKRLHGLLEKQVGAANTVLDGRTETLLRGESSLGKLVADAFRQQSGAQLGLVSASQIQGNLLLESGPMDWQTIYRALPFGNAICVFQLTGEQLLALLALSAKARGAPAQRTRLTDFWQGSRLYVSGLHSWENTQDDPHMTRIETKGRHLPIDPSAIYHVAGPSFLIHGGDGYDVFKQARFWNIGLNDAQCLGAYLANQA